MNLNELKNKIQEFVSDTQVKERHVDIRCNCEFDKTDLQTLEIFGVKPKISRNRVDYVIEANDIVNFVTIFTRRKNDKFTPYYIVMTKFKRF